MSVFFLDSLSCFWVLQKFFFPLEQDLRRHDLREACKPILVPPWSRPTFSPPPPSLKLPVHVCKKSPSS